MWMRMYAASQSEAVNNATGAGPPPTGPFVSFHVVGIEAAVYEFQAGTTPLYDVYTTPAFARSVLPKTTSGFIYLVKLRHGAAHVDAFKNYVKSLGIGTFTSVSTPAALVAGSIHPQAVGWWLLAALAALAGAAVVGQALSRTRRVESDEFPVLQALGLGQRGLVALGMAATLVVGLAGAAGALALAYVLSPLAPVGEARLAEPSTGLHFRCSGPVGGCARHRGRRPRIGNLAFDPCRTRSAGRRLASPFVGRCRVHGIRLEPGSSGRHAIALRRRRPGDHLRNAEHDEHVEPASRPAPGDPAARTPQGNRPHHPGHGHAHLHRRCPRAGGRLQHRPRSGPPGGGQWSPPCPPWRDRVGIVHHAPHRHPYRRRRPGAVRVARRPHAHRAVSGRGDGGAPDRSRRRRARAGNGCGAVPRRVPAPACPHGRQTRSASSRFWGTAP